MIESWLTPPSASRVYHDPLHGAIALDRRDPVEALLIQLIDTPEFQRLRRIRQLGPASLTFHGAEASRFTHSLGVMAIARRAFDWIASRHSELKLHRATVLCAALLHDIGHGPYSHTGEEIFRHHHEQWTARILKESPMLQGLLQRFDPGLTDAILQVFSHHHPVPIIWQLVSSQLDCDRLDYLMRDSYFTGASYGMLDLDRILLAMDLDPVEQQLVVKRKGVTAIEHYLIVRSFMYAQIYNHPKNIAATWVLQQAFQRARDLLVKGQLWADDVVHQWLHPSMSEEAHSNDRLPLSCFLSADDGVMNYHLQRWQSSEDTVLADFCRRWVDRDLPKAVEISDLDEAARNDRLQQVQTWLIDQRLSSAYAGIRTAMGRGYTLYQRGIPVQTNVGMVDINDLSPLVQTLTRPQCRYWLVCPKETPNEFFRLG